MCVTGTMRQMRGDLASRAAAWPGGRGQNRSATGGAGVAPDEAAMGEVSHSADQSSARLMNGIRRSDGQRPSHAGQSDAGCAGKGCGSTPPMLIDTLREQCNGLKKLDEQIARIEQRLHP